MRATALSRSCWRRLVIGGSLPDRLKSEPSRAQTPHRSFRRQCCSGAPLYSSHKVAHRGDIRIKRIYDEPDAADGFRALVDRLWPRGISKQRAALDDWLVELAPSTALRKWFHQDRTRWIEFARRYRAELRTQAAALEALRQRAAPQRVTLLY